MKGSIIRSLKRTCRYCGWDGKCDYWNDTDVMFEHIANSCDNNGQCLVEDDEDPSISCEDYEER